MTKEWPTSGGLWKRWWLWPFDTWGRQRRGFMPKVASWLQAVWKISRDGYQGSGWHSPSCCFLGASIRSEWWWWCWFGVWGLGEDVVVENCAREDGSLYRGQAWWLKRIYFEAMQKLIDTQKVLHLQTMFAGFMGEAFCESKVFLWSRPCVFRGQGPCWTNTEPWNAFHHSVAEETDVSIGLGTPESAIGIFCWSHECWTSLRICSGSFCNKLSMRSKRLEPIKWPLSIRLHALQNSISYLWLPSKRSNAKYCLYEHLHLRP